MRFGHESSLIQRSNLIFLCEWLLTVQTSLLREIYFGDSLKCAQKKISRVKITEKKISKLKISKVKKNLTSTKNEITAAETHATELTTRVQQDATVLTGRLQQIEQLLETVLRYRL